MNFSVGLIRTTMTIKSGIQTRRSILKGHLKDAIRRRKVSSREMKVGKPVDLLITSECECVICLEKLSPTNIAVTPCGHKFCFTCLMENFKSSRKCPLCREVVAPEIPRPRLDDDDIGELVYLNGGEMVSEIGDFTRRMDAHPASHDERDEDLPTEETSEETSEEIADETQSNEDTGAADEHLVEHEEDSDDEDLDEHDEDSHDEDYDNFTDSFIYYDDMVDELTKRYGVELSGREKGILTICLGSLGESSKSVRDWYDRNQSI